MVLTHSVITLLKVNDLDEIWNSVSQMLGAGPGRNLEQCEPNVGGWPVALADFGRDPHSTDSLRGSRNFVVMRITHDFTDFPSDEFYDV